MLSRMPMSNIIKIPNVHQEEHKREITLPCIYILSTFLIGRLKITNYRFQANLKSISF